MRTHTLRLMLSATIALAAFNSSAHAKWPFGLFSKDACGDTACDTQTCDSNSTECCVNPSCETKGCDGGCFSDTFGRKSGLGCSLDNDSCDLGQVCDTGTPCDTGMPCDPKRKPLLDLFRNCKLSKSCDESVSCDMPGCDADGGCGLDSGCDSMGLGNGLSGSYCTLFGGLNQLDDYSGDIRTTQLEGTFSDGWLIGGAHGRRFGDTFRAELEFTFRTNTADEWSVNGATDDWFGHVFTYSGMANLFYDFTQCNHLGINPYIGAGLGFSIIDGKFETNMTEIEIEDETFAYQFMAGASVRVNSRVEAFSEYRFFGVSDFDLTNTGVTPAVDLDGDDIDWDNVIFGLRFSH